MQESLVLAIVAGMLGVLLLAVAMTAAYGRALRFALACVAIGLLVYLANYAFRDVLTI